MSEDHLVIWSNFDVFDGSVLATGEPVLLTMQEARTKFQLLYEWLGPTIY